MKTYNIFINTILEVVQAVSLQEAKKKAQLYKRMNNLKGKTIVKLNK